MNRNFRLKTIFALGVCALAACDVQAQTSSRSATEKVESRAAAPAVMKLGEIRAGMRGTAKTVFSGGEPEDFEVEILGVMPGFVGAKQAGIIGRLQGANAERTFVFAGMSGSPVYIDGRLIGAISFSFPFAKEPICGITPIEQMISIFDARPQTEMPAPPRPIPANALTATSWQTKAGGQFADNFLAAAVNNPELSALNGQIVRPIATPLGFSGFTPEAINLFSAQFASYGMLPVAAAGAGGEISPMKKSDDSTLQAGDSVTMHLTRGDFSLAASGTVTFRDGAKIYAFGHPFLNLGVTDLPMSESSVVTVIPNTNNSFKLAVPTNLVGTMTQDRNTAVFGKLGQQPRMFPTALGIKTSRNNQENYRLEIARDDFLSPLLLNLSIVNTIFATERNIGDSTVAIRGQIKIKGEQPILIERRFSSSFAASQTSGAFTMPLKLVLDSGFPNVEIESVSAEISSQDGLKTGELVRLAINKSQVKAGDTITVQAFMRRETGEIVVENIPLQIPHNTAEGSLLVYAGDGFSLQQVAAARSFVPRNLSELVKTLNAVKKNDRLYVQLVRVTNGAIIGSSELPNLPPSVLATLNNDRIVGGVTPTVISPIVEKELPPFDFVVSGQQVLVVEVIR